MGRPIFYFPPFPQKYGKDGAPGLLWRHNYRGPSPAPQDDGKLVLSHFKPIPAFGNLDREFIVLFNLSLQRLLGVVFAVDQENFL